MYKVVLTDSLNRVRFVGHTLYSVMVRLREIRQNDAREGLFLEYYIKEVYR